MQAEKLTNTQAILLIVGLRFTFFFISIAIRTPPSDQDLWLAHLGSIFYTAVLYSPLLLLNRKFPNRSLWEYPQQIAGKIINKLINLIYVGILLSFLLLLAINMTLFIGSSLLPETPGYVHLFFFLVVAAFAAYKGIFAISRSGQVLIPMVLVFFLLTTVLGVQLFDLKNLLPIYKDSTLWQLNSGSLTFALCFQDALFLFFLAPDMKDKHPEKPFIILVVISTFFFSLISLCPILALGVEQAKHLNYPYYTYVRQITVFDFVERIDPLVVLGWIMVSLFKFSVYLYSTAKGLQQVIGAKSHQKFIIPLAFMVFGLYFVPEKSVHWIDSITVYILPKLDFLVIFAIPFLLVGIYYLRKLFANN
jgi:spore germination protein KB